MHIAVYVFFTCREDLAAAVDELQPTTHEVQEVKQLQIKPFSYTDMRQLFNAQKRDFIWPDDFEYSHVLRIPSPSPLLVVAIQYGYPKHILLSKHKVDNIKYYAATNNEYSGLMNGPEITISPDAVISPNFKLHKKDGKLQSAQLTLIKESGSYYTYSCVQETTSHIRHSRRGTLIVCYAMGKLTRAILVYADAIAKHELIMPAVSIETIRDAAARLKFNIPSAEQIMHILLYVFQQRS